MAGQSLAWAGAGPAVHIIMHCTAAAARPGQFLHATHVQPSPPMLKWLQYCMAGGSCGGVRRRCWEVLPRAVCSLTTTQRCSSPAAVCPA